VAEALSRTVSDAYRRVISGIRQQQVESGTVVFPDDPLKRIEVLWADPEKRGPKSVFVGGIHNAAYAG